MKKLFTILLCFLSINEMTAKNIEDSRKPWLPFISGDAFRYYADHIFDETDTSLNPKSIQPYETIFVKTDYLHLFFQKIHPMIESPYILITHNSDDEAPGIFYPYLEDPLLIAWFGQNATRTDHPKMHPIPIGIANRYWDHGQGSAIENLTNSTKEHLLYLNISVATYPQERTEVHSLLKEQNFVFSGRPGTHFYQYMQELSQSKFVASPRGNGLDTHRLWEALYAGAYPIVKHSSLDPLYEDLPVLIIENWNQITEKFLEENYNKIKQKKLDSKKLQIQYWFDLIDLHKKSI